MRQKLLPQLAGMPQEELRDMRLRGATITERVEVPELVFVGDTRIEVVEREEVVRRAVAVR